MGDFTTKEEFIKKWNGMIQNAAPGKKKPQKERDEFYKRKNTVSDELNLITDPSQWTQEKLNDKFLILTGRLYKTTVNQGNQGNEQTSEIVLVNIKK